MKAEYVMLCWKTGDRRIKLTEPVKPPAPYILAAYFIAHGTATFRSGRRQSIHYCSPVAIDYNLSENQLYVEDELRRAQEKLLAMMKSAENGLLLNWLNGRKSRPVQSAVWEEW